MNWASFIRHWLIAIRLGGFLYFFLAVKFLSIVSKVKENSSCPPSHRPRAALQSGNKSAARSLIDDDGGEPFAPNN